MADSFTTSLAGTASVSSSNKATDAAQIVTPPMYFPVHGLAADTDFTILLWAPVTPITVATLRIVPNLAIAANDTNYISLGFSKSVLTAFSGTSIATAKTTQVTGGAAHVVGAVQSFTVTTAGSANNIAAGTGIYLVMSQQGTGPTWAVTVEIGYTLQG